LANMSLSHKQRCFHGLITSALDKAESELIFELFFRNALNYKKSSLSDNDHKELLHIIASKALELTTSQNINRYWMLLSFWDLGEFNLQIISMIKRLNSSVDPQELSPFLIRGLFHRNLTCVKFASRELIELGVIPKESENVLHRLFEQSRNRQTNSTASIAAKHDLSIEVFQCNLVNFGGISRYATCK
jgi:hypothetical protein